MSFIKEFTDRGYFYQCTDLEELKKLSDNSITFYLGIDCTGASLHAGHLLQIMILRLMQRYGHKPIIIIGDATTKIGDPTGKDEVRKILSDEEIKTNINGIKKSLSKFIKFGDGANDAIMVNNSDWLGKINYIEFLDQIGRDVSVNRMLTMDSVKLRLDREQPLSFLEFNYMLFQGYDFLHLRKEYNCILQLGGSDQWGNIIMGVELIRKKLGQSAIGLTTPLLTTSSGAKMGKTMGGAVWLNEDMLAPYDYFQYWRNCEDNDLIKFTKLFAEYDDKQQDEFETIVKSDINMAKKQFAHRLTELCHGINNADLALETSIAVFEKGMLSDNLPEFKINKSELEKGVAAFELFYMASLAASKSEAKKLIRGDGARVNDVKVEDEMQLIGLNDLQNNEAIKLSLGKKKHILVKLS